MLPGAAAQPSAMMGAQFQKTTMTGEPRSAKQRGGTDLRLFMETLASAQRRAAAAHPPRPHDTGSASCVGEQHTKTKAATAAGASGETFVLQRMLADAEEFCCDFREVDGAMVATAKEAQALNTELSETLAQALNTQLAEALLAQRSCARCSRAF
ncbi:hypothetical protein T484DRAFT_1890288 [Baffinella frigidus]|nr:hypothetical protein T484DRAFT_1890288 [Cryptophyta sp. CCMP2293]